MKMTVCQCRKGSGFLNWSWRQVRNHEILLVQVAVVSVVVRSFHWQETNKLKLSKQCGHQVSKVKTYSFEIFLKWRRSSPIFRYGVNFIGRGQSGKFKAWFYGKSTPIHFFWFEYIFRYYRDTKTEKTFWPYGHFKRFELSKSNSLTLSFYYRIVISLIRSNVLQRLR